MDHVEEENKELVGFFHKLAFYGFAFHKIAFYGFAFSTDGCIIVYYGLQYSFVIEVKKNQDSDPMFLI